MKNLLVHKEGINCNNYTIRNEMYEGQSHIVVPVVMMVEGVHAGSKGPLLHTMDEIGRFPESWNGIPVTIQHPQEGDNFISANSPEAIGKYSVGRIFNVHIDTNKLKAEAWINVDRITSLSPIALQHIKEQQPLDVSTGAFLEEIESQGQYNNEQYIAIATNLRPDHLALLPGGVGACSWNDGCGIRVNKKGGIMEEEGKKVEKTKSVITINKGDNPIEITMKELVNENLSVFPITNEVGYVEIRQLIQRKLDSMDTETRVHYLRELFSNFFIYEVTIRDAEVEGPLLYKRFYTVQEDGGIEFTGEPQRVKREVNYIIVNKLVRTTKKGGKTMDEEKKPCCPDKVDALIANKATKWSKDDKEWLLTQSEEMIEKLFPVETEEKDDPVTQKKEEKKEEIEVNKEKKPKTTEEYLEGLPEEVRESVQTGLRLNAEKRSNLIKTIVDNSNEGVWNEEELKKQDTSMLEKLAKSVSKVDYSGMAAHKEVEIVDNEQEEKLLPNFPTERKEDK